ncbi:MAG: CarD family transcriptional regulator, partial [Anaerolineae bacterium]
DQVLDLERTLNLWAGLGYEPVSVVEAPGQFSHRGGILDIFPPADALPVRIELFGNQVDSLRRFDPATQRSQERVEAITVTPAREALPRHGPRVAERVAAQLTGHHLADERAELEAHREGLAAAMPFPGIEFYLPYLYTHPATLLDYLSPETMVVVDDPQELAAAWASLEEEAVDLRDAAEGAEILPPEYPLPYITWDKWSEQLADRLVLALGYGEEKAHSHLADCFIPGAHFGGELKPLLGHIYTAQSEGGQVVVVSQQAQRLAELWGAEYGYDDGLPVEDLRQPTGSGLTFVQGSLDEGWVMRGFDLGEPFSSLHLLTDAEVFGWRRPEPRRVARRRKVAPEAYFADLTPGDYVVHVEYGIGIFRSLVIRSLEGMEREYLLVEYGEGDRLYVPIHQADRLSRYIGADDRPPQLNRLGRAEWQALKARAKKAAEDVARELLDLYAARELAEGYAFGPDTEWQAELEAAFPYYETEDQLRAIADV